MKKCLLFIIIFICFITNINATTINKIYMDAEVEIAGGIRIREIINVSDISDDIKLNVYYKNDKLKDFDGSDDSYLQSKIYNATKVMVSRVGIIKNDTDITKYTDDNFFEENVEEIEYSLNENENYTNIILNNDEI